MQYCWHSFLNYHLAIIRETQQNVSVIEYIMHNRGIVSILTADTVIIISHGNYQTATDKKTWNYNILYYTSQYNIAVTH